ncbi:MAG: BatD family protein, partial [Bacteroidales bacterium]|nr:BatD family protein [Bacteroidales bacterium]
FSIPAATAVVKGKTISSPSQKIDVVSGGGSSSSSSSGSSSSGRQSQSESSSSGEISSNDLFLRLTLSKTNVVVGEPITATLKLYQRVNIAGFENAKFPTFNGFWSQEVQAPTNIEFHRENLDDMIYNAAVLRSYVIIPQQSGSLTIDPAELVCLVNVRAATGPATSIFDSFFQDEYRTIRKRVTTKPVSVNVAKVPAGAPASYGGGVGSFTMKASLSKDSLKTHDAASLVITITGKGNVALLEAPKVNFPPDFEVYDIKNTQSTDKSVGGTSGSKTFEYPFIPRSGGEFTIEPIEYSYYDVNSGKYVTLSTEPMTIKVAKGNASESSSSNPIVSSNVNRKDVKDLGSDIRYMTTKVPSFSSKGSFFLGSGAFWGLLVAIIAAAAGAFLAMTKMAQRKADVAGSKNRKATKMAQKRLKTAEDFLKKNLYTAFYEELHRAMLGFISDKLNMDMSELSKDNIAAALSSEGVPEETITSYTGLLDACEFARYAPDAGHDAMNAHYETAVNVISSIDSSMKGKKSPSSKNMMAILILMLSIPTMLNAESKMSYVDSLWNAATGAYADGRYDDALHDWQGISMAGVESPELYYNIGNAAFKSSDYARAILNYERALKLDPSYSDARYNLDFANSMIQDKIEPVPEFILKTVARKICWIMDSNAWAVLFLLFLAGTLALVVVFLLSQSVSTRRISFYSAIVLVLLSLSAIWFSAWQKSEYQSADTAVVMIPVSAVKSSPSADGAKDLFILHEGTKVTILDEVGSWKNIELADGRQGWIKSSDVETI